jgi:MFS transporter, DHA1 family, multidrug resistance protein
MSSRFMGPALVLGLLSAIGPFAIDMYLPALPSIQHGLQANEQWVQMSLMVFFASLGVGQLIYGPVSDMVGRKPPLYAGLALFALSSMGCALAPNIHTLIVCRFVQGLGACAGTVIPRAVVRDMHTGADAAQLMALLMLVFSVSPILAPLTGSLIIAVADWRGIFYVITGAALVGLLLVHLVLEETRPPQARLNSGFAAAWRGYIMLLKDRHIMGLIFIGAFGISSFFVYLANSSFVLMGHYGLSPIQYSMAFSANAIAFIGAAQFAGRLGGRYGLKRMVRVAATAYAAVMLLLALLFILGAHSLPMMMVLLFTGYCFLGLVIPSTAVLAMDKHGEIAGTVSALMGTLQMVTGAVAITIAGWFVNGTALPMLCGIACVAFITFILAQWTLRQQVTDVVNR